jgi:WD40 repeat protein
MQDDQLLVALGEQEAILWDRRTGERIASLSHPRPIGAFGQLAISSPSQPAIVAIPTTKGVVLWDAKRRKTVGAPLVGSDKPASVVAFSPDGRVMAAGGNGSLSLWDVHSSTNLGHSLPQGFGSSVGFSPDGRILATGSDDGKVTLWDPERGRNLRSYTSHPSTYAGGESFTTHPVLSLAFSPDGQTLASSDSKSVVVWDIKNWHPLARPLIGHFDDMGYSPGDWSVAFNPRGPTFASISTEGVTLWDTLHWQRIKTLDVGHGSFTAIAFNPNGTVLAIGSGAQIILWDMKNMRPTGSPLTSGSPIAFSPSGRLLASVSQRDSTIILWDVEHHKTVGKPLPLTNPAVSSLAFSPDGRTLAIGSEGENQEVPNVMLWDVNQREPLGKPLVGSGGSVAFAPDGRTLAAAGQGGVILWRVGIAEWRNQACDLLRSLAVPNASLELSRQEYQRLCG